MRVGILPTGDTELHGLPRALASLFQDHEFYPIGRRQVSGKLEPYSGFTSSRVSSTPDIAKKSDLTRLVDAAAAHIEPGRNNNPPDLLVVIDDLELANAADPGAVTAAFRHTTRAYLEKLSLHQNAGFVDRVRTALKERVSFHLAAPMIEAWLFAGGSGPGDAGVPTGRLCHLVDGQDPEQFCTDDPVYGSDDGSECAPWRSKAKRPAWMRDYRTRHPKAYLAWLCRDPRAKKCSTYRETCELGERCGATALASLDWAAALSDHAHCRFMRSLVEDLADALGVDNPYPGQTSPLTSRFELPRDPVLRNL